MGEAKRRKMSPTEAATFPIYGKVKSVQGLWAQWFEVVLAKQDPSPVQIRETKRAFYAAIQGFLYMMMHRLDHTDDWREVTDADAKWMEGIEKELSDFSEAVKRGEQ